MANENATDKPASESLPEAAGLGATVNDELGESSPQTEGQKQDADASTKTLNQVVTEQLEKEKGATEESSTEEEAKEKSVSESETDEEKETAEADKEGEKVGEEKEELTDEEEQVEEQEKGPVPYERFKEVNDDRTEVKRQLEEVKPLVENYNKITGFCRQFGITGQEFEQAMKIAALARTSPQEALKELLPVVEGLKALTGDRLPPDLQEMVDSGNLSLELAQKWAKDKATAVYGQNRAKQTEEQIAAQRQQMVQKQLSDAVMAWETTKQQSDPDYKPKAKTTEADGKWEEVDEKFYALLHKTNERGEFAFPCFTAQDLVALKERAYVEVTKRWTSRGLKPATRKVLSSTKSSGNGKQTALEDAPTMRDAVKMMARQRGIHLE